VACMPNIDSRSMTVEIERDWRSKLFMKLIRYTIYTTGIVMTVI
jgi:hypothetical protein